MHCHFQGLMSRNMSQWDSTRYRPLPIAMGKYFFFCNFSPRKMTIYLTFLGWMSRLFPHSPLTFEGIFIEILNGPFGIFNKIGTLLILSLTILLRSWISVINQNQPKLPLYTHFFASSGHDLVNFNKKYQLAPFLVLKSFKTTEICNKIWILEPQTQRPIS